MIGTSTEGVRALATAYLPAERASAEELARQSARVAASPLIAQLLNATLGFALMLNRQRQLVLANDALREWAAARGLELREGLRPGELLHCVNATLTEGGCGTTEACRYCGAAQGLAVALGGQVGVRECRIRRDGAGDDLDLLVRATPIEIEGEPFVLFATIDISHEKRRRALERIFFHDITDTAGGIRGLAGLVVHSPSVSSMQTYAPMLERASETLLDEIASQRDLAAAEAGELRPKPTALSARALLERLLEVSSHHDVAQDRTLSLDEGDDVQIVTDRTLLLRVLANLVKNALEAEPKGARVTVSCRLRDGRVRFEVHNPTVMPREVQLQLFQRSFSTKGPGRGLGTYGIRLLTERYLGGTVRFTSTAQEGTRFVAEYPLSIG